jgi:hypothetical protein
MKIKKMPFVISFAIATLLVVGTSSFASSDNSGMGNMMNGNGMGNMMDSEGMGNMMNGEGMGQMMEAMNSPEGQEMMNSCSNFMDSNEDIID